MPTQDFSRRIIVVVRKDLEAWQIANTIGHISAYLGNQLKDSFGTGDNFTTKDGASYPRNSQYPIIIKRAGSSEQLRNLLKKVRTEDVLHHVFLREMLDFGDDTELQNALSAKTEAEVELLGVGVFGLNETVSTLTKKFGLWE